MANITYDKWYWEKWFADTAMLSIATKGVWVEILGHMFLANRAGGITAKTTELCRMIGCTDAELNMAIEELDRLNVAVICRRGDCVTISCRHCLKRNTAPQTKPNKQLKSELPLFTEQPKPTPKFVTMVDKIYNAYPKKTKIMEAKKAISDELNELASTTTPDEAGEFLLSKTQEYVKIVAQWPQSKRRFIRSPDCFYRDKSYMNLEIYQTEEECKNERTSGYDERLGVRLG